MSRDLWRVGVQWKDHRPDGNIRHSQVVSTFGPGALVDFVDDAAIVAGLSWWAKGPSIVEDRLVAMLARQQGYEQVVLHAPPASSRDLEDPDRKWIKAFRFPQWFACQNEHCWVDSDQPPRRDSARPRRLLHLSQLDGAGHKCKGGKGKTSKVQPIRFVRACKLGHIDDIGWGALVHRNKPECSRRILWIDEAAASGDLADVRITCSGCGENLRMSVAAQLYSQITDQTGAKHQVPTLDACEGRQPWLGGETAEGCGQAMRLLLRSASHAYFAVNASVIHIPDPDADLRDRVAKVYDLVKAVKSPAQIELLRELQDVVRIALEGISDEMAFAEVVRRREAQPVARKKVKEAEIEVLLNCPPALATDQPNGRFYARTISHSWRRRALMKRLSRVVVIPRLVEVRALAGFTRFEPKTTDVDGELDIGAEVARPDEPLTWLPAVENFGEGFFFSLDEPALAKWEMECAVRDRHELFKAGFKLWQGQRDDRKKQKDDFANARFVLLHSLSHLLITAVSLDCGYSASSIRERIYAGAGGSGILLYTASPGAEGSLGGLVEVGRHIDRYLEQALELGRLCANDPVCAAHSPDHEDGRSDRFLEGASCHGCLLISEPSCERMNQYLDRTLVVPTVETADAAFFR
ncbi:MAG: DUF1998 domain-containing protein [Deltaproteobacteria bacterium]|nr:DUF1998 domain-containing protein [Deltaproteobacteria bacterium]